MFTIPRLKKKPMPQLFIAWPMSWNGEPTK